jgi:hypothetical protein
MNTFLVQVIRSLVSVVVGAVVGWLASLTIRVAPEVQVGLILSLSTLVTSLYYIGVAWLERKFPWFGWLLGVARKPVYAPLASTAASNATGKSVRKPLPTALL